jgi:adenylylsulfate kinase-like enzyme
MALDLARTGQVAVVAMVSPIAKDRNEVRRKHDLENIGIVEIWISTPLEICERRDPKGLYRRARLSTLLNVTGIDSPYEPPTNADLVLSLTDPTPGDALTRVLRLIVSVAPPDTDDPSNGEPGQQPPSGSRAPCPLDSQVIPRFGVPSNKGGL